MFLWLLLLHSDYLLYILGILHWTLWHSFCSSSPKKKKLQGHKNMSKYHRGFFSERERERERPVGVCCHLPVRCYTCTSPCIVWGKDEDTFLQCARLMTCPRPLSPAVIRRLLQYVDSEKIPALNMVTCTEQKKPVQVDGKFAFMQTALKQCSIKVVDL